MSLFTESQLRAASQSALRKSWSSARTARDLLREQVSTQASYRTYDIFLSHAFSDAELILGLRNELVAMGFSVYVDWIDDATLDRKSVTTATAATLRTRMQMCSSLLFATSDAAAESKWMPWELGYFDALREGRVAIVPISESRLPGSDWKGREYLGLYPYITRDTIKGTATETIWVHTSADTYVWYNEWMKGKLPSPRN